MSSVDECRAKVLTVSRLGQDGRDLRRSDIEARVGGFEKRLE